MEADLCAAPICWRNSCVVLVLLGSSCPLFPLLQVRAWTSLSFGLLNPIWVLLVTCQEDYICKDIRISCDTYFGFSQLLSHQPGNPPALDFAKIEALFKPPLILGLYSPCEMIWNSLAPSGLRSKTTFMGGPKLCVLQQWQNEGRIYLCVHCCPGSSWKDFRTLWSSFVDWM